MAAGKGFRACLNRAENIVLFIKILTAAIKYLDSAGLN